MMTNSGSIRMWRFRAVVNGYIDLPVDRSILCWRATFSKMQDGHEGEAIYLLDIFIKDADPKQVYWRGLDLSWKVVDALGFLSLSRVRLQVLSVVPPLVATGEVFEMVFPEAQLWQNRATIEFENLTEIVEKIDEKTAGCFRSFREALSSENPLHAFALLWSSAEPIFEDIAKTSNLFSPDEKCPKCGESVKTGRPASQQAMDKFNAKIKTAGDSNITPNRLRKFRSTILHGAKLADDEFRKEVQSVLPAMFALVANVLAEKTASKSCFSSRAKFFQSIVHLRMSFATSTRVQVRWDFPGAVNVLGSSMSMAQIFTRGQEDVSSCMLQELDSYNPVYLPEVI